MDLEARWPPLSSPSGLNLFVQPISTIELKEVVATRCPAIGFVPKVLTLRPSTVSALHFSLLDRKHKRRGEGKKSTISLASRDPKKAISVEMANPRELAEEEVVAKKGNITHVIFDMDGLLLGISFRQTHQLPFNT